MEYGKDRLSFTLPEAMPTPAQPNAKTEYKFEDYNLTGKNTILYEEALPATDLIWMVGTGYLKEYAILKEPGAMNRVIYDVEAEEYDVKQTENTVCLVDHEGETVFELGQLFAVDSAGAYTDKLYYEVEEGGDGTYKVTVTVSEDWLAEPERVYPVLVDPSVMVTGASDTYDTFVSSRYNTQNYYTSIYVRAGQDNAYKTCRTYIKFKIPDVVYGSTINSAKLKLKKFGSGSSPSLRVYRATGSWTSSTLKWDNKPSYTTTNAATIALSTSNWYTGTVTKIVKSWADRTYSNFGFVIKDTNEDNSNHWMTMYSSDADSPNKPELIINYTPPMYYGSRPYQQAPLGRASNCMGYALEYKEDVQLALDLYEMAGMTTAQLLTYTESKAIEWMNSKIGSSNYTSISAYDSDINSNYFRVILRVGFIDENGNGVYDTSELFDFHWWYQTNENNGQWAGKQGGYASERIAESNGTTNPTSLTSKWTVETSDGTLVYNSSGKYYQVKDLRSISW